MIALFMFTIVCAVGAQAGVSLRGSRITGNSTDLHPALDSDQSAGWQQVFSSMKAGNLKRKCQNIMTDPCSCTFTNPDGGDGGVTCEGGAITAINLNSINLSGSLNDGLAQLTKLTSLSLYGNELKGSVPGSLSQLTALTSLALHDNALSGKIPKSLAKLTRLTSLALQCNSLNGTVPAATQPG